MVSKSFSKRWTIQPVINFTSEVQFYYIKDKFEYAQEFIPSKIPIYSDAIDYKHTEKELEVANSFAKLNRNYYGIQRIDFLKSADGRLLLTEIEDISPYLDLDCVEEEVKERFINDYKNMEYLENSN